MFDYAGMLMGGGQGFGGGTNAMTMDPRMGGGGLGGQQLPWWLGRGMGGQMGRFPGMGGGQMRDIGRFPPGMPFGGMPGRGMAGGPVLDPGRPEAMQQQNPMIGPGGPVRPPFNPFAQ